MLTADALHWLHPDHDSDQVRQRVMMVQADQAREMAFTLDVYPSKPGIAYGLRTLAME